MRRRSMSYEEVIELRHSTFGVLTNLLAMAKPDEVKMMETTDFAARLYADWTLGTAPTETRRHKALEMLFGELRRIDNILLLKPAVVIAAPLSLALF